MQNEKKCSLSTYYIKFKSYDFALSLALRELGRERGDFDVVATAPAHNTMYVEASADAVAEIQKLFSVESVVLENGTTLFVVEESKE
jgi:hypothetical protein